MITKKEAAHSPASLSRRSPTREFMEDFPREAGTGRYYTNLAAAFVRGRLETVAGTSDELIARGLAAGLRLHKFKRDSELPRVRTVIGAIRGMTTASLLDCGSGRGTFLWPLVAALPSLAVTAVDSNPQRVADIDAVRKGGVPNLGAVRADVCALPFASQAFEVVTALEVLEHLERPGLAVREAIRVARRFVIVSVPSKPDDNPEHVNVFDNGDLERLLTEAGARRVRFDSVLNHRIAVASL